jgi:DNA polymerase II small subunit
MLDMQSIVQRFLDTKLQVHPDVVRYLSEQGDPGLVDRIIAGVPEDIVVVSLQHVPGIVPERDGTRFLTDPQIEVLSGAAGSAGNVAHVEDYMHYFRDRYTRLGSMIRNRCSPIPIEGLKKAARYRQEQCAIVGMVMDVRTSTNGHRIVEMEDTTGNISALFNKDRPGFTDAEHLLPDEVVGVRGTLSTDGRMFFADQLYRPDIPLSHAPFKSEASGRAVFISDVHVGSDTFLEAVWNRFADWLDDSGASYLLIAGDLVDGIGVYPGQEKELTIRNIYEQYDVFGEMIRDLPGNISIILSPGNHDVVRGAEPQPAIPARFTSRFPSNCTLVENPALISLQGVRVLMYHGRSIDDMIGTIPGASYQHAAEMMDGMLQRRHLAPTYGRRTPVAADRNDRLLIDPIPEVLHTGHVHIMGMTEYRGVLGINAGAWQSQTSFQKQMNINPTPGIAIQLDLQTLVPQVMDFN